MGKDEAMHDSGCYENKHEVAIFEKRHAWVRAKITRSPKKDEGVRDSRSTKTKQQYSKLMRVGKGDMFTTVALPGNAS